MKQITFRHGAIWSVALLLAACGSNDAGIGKRVNEKLSADETVKPARITVDVQKKIVTLSGTVDTPAVKQRAVAVARATDGVADVVDQIQVKEQNSGPGYADDHRRGHEMMEKGPREHEGRPAEIERR